MGGTARTLSPGGVLWGLSHNPYIVVPNHDADGLVNYSASGGDTLALNDVIDMGSNSEPWAAVDSNNDNAYLPCPMSLQFSGTGTWDVDITIVGLNQFGEKVTEIVQPSNSATVSTNFCYSKVITMTVTTVDTAFDSTDTFDVGHEHNANVDCAYPLPFRVRSADNIAAVAIGSEVYDGSDITVSTVYNTVTVKNSAAAIPTGIDVMGSMTIVFAAGAAGTY